LYTGLYPAIYFTGEYGTLRGTSWERGLGRGCPPPREDFEI